MNRGKVSVHFLKPPRQPWLRAAIVIFACAFCVQGNASSASAAESGDDWVQISHSDSVSIYSRVHPGGTLREFKAVGTIDASARALLAVLDDVEDYPHFMPFMAECRVIRRDEKSVISYQRIAPPFCTDRDYSIRVRHEIKPSAEGPVFICRWELANALGPPEQNNVLRVKVNEGSWIIEPQEGNTARATYNIYTDSGGSLPGWLAEKANQIAINKLFDAIRKQVKESKYASPSDK